MPLTFASIAAAFGVRAPFVRPHRRNGGAKRGPALLAGLALGGLATFAGPTGAAAAPPKGYFLGDAYATYGTVKAGPLAASLGPTAYIPCPCLGTNGEPRSTQLAGITVGLVHKVLQTGLIRGTVQTKATANAQTASDLAKAEGVFGFDGLIVADAVQAGARVVATDGAVKTDDSGSNFVNLKVAGRQILGNVQPNTRIPLAGLGYVTLKRESKTGDGVNNGRLAVDMIAVTITTANVFGLPIGAEVIVGHASAGYVKGNITQTVSGRAWGTSVYANVPALVAVNSGLTAFQPLGCGGTDGKSISTYAAGVVVKPVLSMGTAVSTAFGKGAFAQTQSTIDNVSLLNGLIGATGLKAVATTYIAKGVRVRSTEGTTFGSLKVLGIALPIKVKPNTKIGLLGIGYVMLNEQIIPSAKSEDETVVNAIRVVVTHKNLFGLPVGAVIIVGHAAAGASTVAAGS